MILEMYELLRVIGANYKLSDFEFSAKVKYFSKIHESCGEECPHIDLFLKKMIVKTHINKTISKIGQNNVFKLIMRQ